MTPPHRIVEAVCEAFGVSQEDVFGPSRTRFASEPRKMIAFLLRRHTILSLDDVTRYLNRENHTTCIYWIKCSKHRMETSPAFRDIVDRIEQQLEELNGQAIQDEGLPGSASLLREGTRHPWVWTRLERSLQQVSENQQSKLPKGSGVCRRDAETDPQT